MLPPRISVLLPAFDCAGTIGVALESVRRQRESSFECIIVDDGSRDATGDIAAQLARRDPRFRLIARSHMGLVQALNAGLEECGAPVIARMDGDDVMSRERLSTALAALEGAPGVAGVGARVRLFPRQDLTPNRLAYERWLNAIGSADDVRREAFVECPIAHPTLTIRAHVLQRFRYRERDWPEDYDLVLRLLAEGYELAVVPSRLHHWRDSPGRYSRTQRACSIERFIACKASFLAEGFLRESAQFILWGYGDTGRQLCRALGSHGKVPRHIVELHPGRIGQRIAGATVIPPAELPLVTRAPIVVSVAGGEARGLIRADLARMCFVEGRDFVVAA